MQDRTFRGAGSRDSFRERPNEDAYGYGDTSQMLDFESTTELSIKIARIWVVSSEKKRWVFLEVIWSVNRHASERDPGIPLIPLQK